MTYKLNQKQISLAVSCALALVVVSGAARAELDPADTGYLVDQRGKVVRSGFGLCWHTGTGPAMASPNECDSTPAPALAAKNIVPVPKAVVPPPPPVPVTKPAADKVRLNADTLFDFNKAVLRPAGREALDAFIAKSKGLNLEVIMAVGHADRFGSEAYNQRLSEQRAAAVKTYLISKSIEPNRIYTEGKGETQPATDAAECKGAKSAKVVACLQPDRRVDIEVVGTRVSQ